MKKKDLKYIAPTLYAEAQELLEAASMDIPVLEAKARYYWKEKDNPERVPRQREEIKRILGQYVFEICMKNQDIAREIDGDIMQMLGEQALHDEDVETIS